MCRLRKVDIIGVSLLTSAVISKDKSIYFKFTPRNLCLDSFCFFAIQSGIIESPIVKVQQILACELVKLGIKYAILSNKNMIYVYKQYFHYQKTKIIKSKCKQNIE